MEDMKHIIQPTGYRPIDFEVKGEPYRSLQLLEGDKRGVELSLYETEAGDGGRWLAVLRYVTTWGTEREFTRIYQSDDLDELAEQVRHAAKSVLPPGAGFPATPQYETRQAKLSGMLETLTLTALSEVLAAAPGE